ncbi:hypothetical protein EJ02DRAFT_511376 [Clathrospora elynae]|uniref:Bacteriophage T5 Orf172 DNA-binding domain-containing protein n=1 Tax=Clathrospora elynae TaxID=706981 RepID=A0A6A5T1I1_9PLEO|nr:hypothetical protein EJ02DRAFT_511376 [Clathrospora elynae]
MPIQSSLLPSAIEPSRSYRRRRSADDQSMVSSDAPSRISRRKPTTPTPSPNWPIWILSDSDLDEETDPSTPSIRKPKTLTARSEPTLKQPSSEKDDCFLPPKTPVNVRSKLNRQPATDPGNSRKVNSDVFKDTVAGLMGQIHRDVEKEEVLHGISKAGSMTEGYSEHTDKKSSSNSPSSADKISLEANGSPCLSVVSSKTLGLEDKPNSKEPPMVSFVGPQINAPTLHTRIREKLNSMLTPTDQEGYIYIFSDPKRPQLHKIGRSRKTVSRLGQLQYKCGLKLNLVRDIHVNYYIRTEVLIHAYLSDLCRPYKCDACNASHGEWFEIAEEPAKALVSRWVDFMSQEIPYDPETRQIQPFMQNLVKIREYLFENADIEFQAVRKHWDQIMLPSSLDRFQFKFDIFCEVLLKFCWPISTMVAWTVTFVVSQHPVTFMCLVASVIGTFICMSNMSNRKQSQ